MFNLELFSPKPSSKKRKRDETVGADVPEIPVVDPFNEIGDFGNLQIPELLSFPTINPDLASAQNLTFGEDFAPSAIELLEESGLAVGCTTQVNDQPAVKKIPVTSGSLRSIDVTEATHELPKKRRKTEDETRPCETVSLTLPDLEQTNQEQAQQNVESHVCQVVEQELLTPFDVPVTKANELGDTILANIVHTTAQENHVNPEVVTQVAVAGAEPVALDVPTGSNYAVPLEEAPLPPEPYTIPSNQLNAPCAAPPEHVRRVRRTAAHSKLVVDQELRLTVNQLRWNMEHSEDTMVPLESLLAEPASRTKTRYLLSRCVPRLLALPANLETALSIRLCELWCRHRRMGEDACGLEADALITNDKENLAQPQSDTRITEETMEASIELQRAGQTTISLPHSVSLLGASDMVMDLTVNQAANVADSNVSLTTPLPDRPALPEEPSARQDGLVDAPTGTTGVEQTGPNLTETIPTQVDLTVLGPLPEEKDENLLVSREPINSAFVTDAGAVNYLNSDEVWRAIKSHLDAESGDLTLEQLCPRNSSRRVAALTFATVLQLAKKRRINVSQSEPYAPIHIALAT
ncbi:unnamed protein product [Echinostoma caproni]|uniref:Rad21_Rec8 domain-containing protein n=1 Tax=Echinostoma caproni TaxID=27848 RepID=A0A183A9C7_9TREM|nr:unnamed protein product [Echinostoma caproni]